MCGNFFKHGIGSIIAKALPIAAAFIPGVGPIASAALTAGAGALGTRLQGGSWGDALKSGALSGLTSAAVPFASNAFSSAFPETAADLGIFSRPTVMDSLGAPGMSNYAGPTGPMPQNASMNSYAGTSPLSDAYAAEMGGQSPALNPGVQNADPSLGGGSAASDLAMRGKNGILSNIPVIGPVLGQAGDWITKNPLPTAMGIGSVVSGLSAANNRANQQKKLQDMQNAKNAQDLSNWRLTLQTPPLNRTPNPAMDKDKFDYSQYGYGPEQSFFLNNQIAPSNYMAKGGLIRLRKEMGKYADGGPMPRRNGSISGPGGPTGDKIPSMLSDGEYVIRARSVSHLGGGNNDAGADVLDAINNGQPAQLRALGKKIRSMKGAT